MMNATPPRRDQERNPGRIDPDLAVEDAPGDRVPGEDLNQRQEKLIDDHRRDLPGQRSNRPQADHEVGRSASMRQRATTRQLA